MARVFTFSTTPGEGVTPARLNALQDASDLAHQAGHWVCTRTRTGKTASGERMLYRGGNEAISDGADGPLGESNVQARFSNARCAFRLSPGSPVAPRALSLRVRLVAMAGPSPQSPDNWQMRFRLRKILSSQLALASASQVRGLAPQTWTSPIAETTVALPHEVLVLPMLDGTPQGEGLYILTYESLGGVNGYMSVQAHVFLRQV